MVFMFMNGRNHKALLSLLLSAALVTSTVSFSAAAAEAPEKTDCMGIGEWLGGLKGGDPRDLNLKALDLKELNPDDLKLKDLNLDNLKNLNLKDVDTDELRKKFEDYYAEARKYLFDNLPDPSFDSGDITSHLDELKERWKGSQWDLDNIDEFIQSIMKETKDVPQRGSVFGDESFGQRVMSADKDDVFRILVTFPVHDYSNDLYIWRSMNIPDEKWDKMSDWNKAVKEFSIRRGAFMDTAAVYNKKYIEALGIDPNKVDIDKEFPAFVAELSAKQILDLAQKAVLPITIYEYDGDADLAQIFYAGFFQNDAGVDLSNTVKVYLPKFDNLNSELALEILRKGAGYDDDTPSDEKGNSVSFDLDFDSSVTSGDALFALRASVGLETDYTAVEPYVYSLVDLTSK